MRGKHLPYNEDKDVHEWCASSNSNLLYYFSMDNADERNI